ncbi:flagellar basal body protein FliL [Alteriqipengyuania lutimaris]|uniref:Flagellar protein FliL n=1 Tax=Alteriqipengyuania lutimaris TaxID=1538146 RepID=A0A395LNR1_9SPHN|nr:flagellar basal body protein FliL [Alteriqipengyuania lutimaris]
MTESTEDGTAPGEAAKAPRFSKKKKIIAAVGAVLLLGGGTAGVLMAGGSGEGGSEADHGDSASKDHGGKSKDHGKEGKGHGEGKGDLVEVAPMTVNLRTNDGQARFLKLRILLAAESSEDVTTIETNLPLIIDRYQPFLRELRPEDLAGSAAVYRLKEELILRAADTVGPGVVADVLIQDMVQQ